MINSFLSIETITRGLEAQQLKQDVTATNLAKTYLDSSGYLITSRQRLDIMEATPLLFGNMGGLLSVGTGPLSQQITRLRSMFLDSQIQQESSILGKAEILANSSSTGVLSQINGIINGSSGTLNAALTNFAAAWATLAATPSSVALRSTVVNDGVAFANLARNQFTQLVTLQTGMNDQINQTVTNINQLLQQLSSLNKQLLGSQGANVNDLLDARDYALDKLSRLINIQSNFGTAGTVNVFLGSSSLSLVDSAGAAILQTNDLNPHNPGLVNINIQDSEGSVIPQDATSLITGGNLAGELQARDVILENYKTQLDQVATSVMNVTNIFHQAGYAADGNTTNTAFFTGTTAQDINVNEALVSDPTRALLAASSRQGFVLTTESTSPINSLPTVPINPAYSILSQLGNFAIPPTGGSFTVNGVTINYTTGSTINGIVGQINGSVPGVTASFNVATQEFNFSSVNPVTIGEIGGDNFVLWASIGTVSTQNGQIAQFLGNLPNLLANNYMESQPSISGAPINPNLAISTQAPLLATAPSAAGIFNLNMTTVSWTNADSIYTILDKINAADPNVQAVYNYTQKAFYLLSNNPVNVSDISGNFTAWANTQDVLVSSVRMNNGFTLAPKIPQIITAPQLLNSANNTMAFRVTPGTSGTFVLNGVTINWTNTQTFNSIRAAIGGIPGMGASFSNAAQTFTLFNKTPIQIIDTSGNFTVFTGLNGNTPIGNLASGILTQITSDLSAQQLTEGQASTSLTQLNNAQADAAAVAINSGDHGEPIAVEQQNAVNSLIAYNASLQVLQVIDQMYSDLVGIIGGSPSGSFFQPRI